MLPRPLFRALLALGAQFTPPVRSEGQVLDPAMAALLRQAGQTQANGIDLPALRARYSGLPRAAGLPVEPGITVRDTTIAERPGRLYTPGAPTGSLLYFHGGGFIMGGLESHDRLLRRLAGRAQLTILSVAYRLAPEHPYPAAHDDAVAALREALTRLPAPLAIGGDSAGANLAASACLQQDGPVLQALLYPIVDAVADEADRYPSAARYGRGFLLDLEALEACAGLLSPGADRDCVDWAGPRLSPMRHDLSHMPPASITVAGFDPLRDQGYAYAAALRRAGVRATVWLEPALIHGFADFAGVVPGAARAVDRFAARIRMAMRLSQHATAGAARRPVSTLANDGRPA